MTDDSGLLLFLYRDCVFKVADGVQLPKAGSLLFSRHIRPALGERVLEIGAGVGLVAILAARAGCRVIATDVVEAATRCVRENAVLNGVGDRVDVRVGDCYEPVGGLVFDLICSSPPQMPTPADRERDDPVAAADNGGLDGWALLDRLIAGASTHLAPGGRLIFTLFAFLGLGRAEAALKVAGLEFRVIGQETQAFPRIGHERLDHIRRMDRGGTLPASGHPVTVERYVIEGRKPR